MRDYRVVVPSDCVASVDSNDNEAALRHMERVLKAQVTPSTELDLAALLNPPDAPPR